MQIECSQKAMYPYLHRVMFGRYMSDICPWTLYVRHISCLGFHLRKNKALFLTDEDGRVTTAYISLWLGS